jgi:uncharacterized iron-regulated membrane protein
MTIVRATPSPPARGAGLSGAYRAVWRWHFYAGLLVLPVLMLMALTGSVYLFKAEIEDAVYRPLAQVAPAADAASADRWWSAAGAAGRGEVVNVLIPDRDDRAVRFTLRDAAGQERYVFVNPYTAQATGVAKAGGITETIKRLHSLELVGGWANIVVEIVAGWSMILVATGLYLWWPRRRDVGVLTVKARSGRPFWRDLHAVTGLYAGAVIVFLAFTGMPWSAVWGDRILNVMRESGLGRPPAPAAASAWSHAEHEDAPQGVGWTLEHAAVAGASPLAPSLTRVVAAAERQQLTRPYLISVPKTEGLAWTAAHQATRVEKTRVIYVDAATGSLRGDVRYAQFGWGAKAFEWGIATHQGTQYGQLNRVAMLLGCIAIWILAISGLVMWWTRRPSGRLAAPVVPPGPRVRAAVLGIVIPFCILYPLTGLSLLVVLLLDWAARTLIRPRPVAS